jgi:diguanylate cyclase (GGDEF)-like protein/PAS domain S-box-containing protein
MNVEANVKLNVLIIQDTVVQFRKIEHSMRSHGLRAHCLQADRTSSLENYLHGLAWDAVLSDHVFADMVFADNLSLIRATLPEVPVIVVAAQVGEQAALKLLKLGVTDIISTDMLGCLAPAIARAVDEVATQRALRSAALALEDRDELISEMGAVAKIGGWHCDVTTDMISWTDAAAHIYDAGPGKQVSRSYCHGFFNADCRRKLDHAHEETIRLGKRFDLELEIVTRRRLKKWIRMVGAPRHGSDGVEVIRGVVQDISAQKRNELMLFAQKERAEVTLRSIGEGVITTDANGTVDFINPIAQQLTGWSEGEAVGKPLNAVMNLIEAESGQPVQSIIASVLAQEKIERISPDSVLVRRDGRRRTVEDSAAPIRDSQGRVVGAVVVFRDVTSTREITAQIAYRTTHDALTALPNRLLAWDRLSQAISAVQRHGGCVGIMSLDIDRFQHLNDSLGYAIGDRLLAQVAARLQSATRTVDTVSRQGGDEFLLIVPSSCDLVFIDGLARKIHIAISNPYFLDEHELNITFSMGISVFPNDGVGPSELIKNADSAMWHAKQSELNSYQFYAPEMNEKASARHSLEAALRRGVAQQEFIVCYQPKMNLARQKLVGAEALIRWRHPTIGMLNPSEFIGIAEECGLIVPIGQWVAEQVCRQSQAWLKDGLPCVPVSVNLSALQFRNKSLVVSLKAMLEQFSLPPSLLELELTESFIMHGTDSVLQTLRQLKQLGVNLSIDDFGTGYSSLSYLKRFPIDTLKIDQSFVRDITHNKSDAAIVKAIISMAHSMQMKVIAEGVETKEQFAFLKSHHCDEIQGYYFSPPLAAPEFEKMLGQSDGAAASK